MIVIIFSVALMLNFSGIGSGNDQAKSSLLEAAKTWSASECNGLRYETFLKVGGEYFIY